MVLATSRSHRHPSAESVTVEELSAMTAREFRSVVEDEVRGDTHEQTSEALRSLEIIERFYFQLVIMQRSVEGQLAARAEDFAKVRARLTSNGRSGGQEYQQHRIDYADQRGRSLRFKVAVEENLMEVKYLLTCLSPGRYGTMLTEERDRLARRVRLLETAIREHHEHFPGDEDPSTYDQHLWALVEQANL